MNAIVFLPKYANDLYTPLGLAHNPFIAEQIPGTAVEHWLALDHIPQQPPRQARQFVQILGVKGAGKTSLLLHWRNQLAGPYYYTPPTLQRWRMPPLAEYVYWDELDRMASPIRWLALKRAWRRGSTIFAGTHCDLAPLAGRLGFTCTTLEFPNLTPERLQEFVHRRIRSSLLDPARPTQLKLDMITAQRIADQAGASWRIASDLLHKWVVEQAQHYILEDHDGSTGKL